MRLHNPIDTQQQREHELLALAYYRHPEIQQTRAEVRQEWLDLTKPGPAGLQCFDAAFDEVMFGAAIWALNQDPLYPKVTTISRVPHSLLGERIPGSRWGIDNPDSVYRIIPISGDERYVIRGRVAEKRMIENYFTLWSPTMQTVGLLNGKDLEVDADGFFEITVDNSPAQGRSNHVQTGPDAHEFYIRDVIFDWAADRPNELSVERLSGAPARAPRSEAENIESIKTLMRKHSTNTTRWNQQALSKPANEFEFIIDRDSDGALRGQIYILGQFKLENEHSALVLHIDMGGADYFIAPITNDWGTSNGIVERNGCLNKHQARANADGSYTFVVSMQDPGVHNWLDPCDMNEGILTLRWAEFASGQPSEGCGVRSELTTLSELQAVIPDQGALVSPDERAEQLQQRAQSYAWRLDSN